MMLPRNFATLSLPWLESWQRNPIPGDMSMTTNDQRWHLMATPTVTLRNRLCDEVWTLEKLGHELGGLLADERTILDQLYAAEVFRGVDMPTHWRKA